MDDAIQAEFASNSALEGIYGHIWNKPGIDFSIALVVPNTIVLPRALRPRTPLARRAPK